MLPCDCGEDCIVATLRQHFASFRGLIAGRPPRLDQFAQEKREEVLPEQALPPMPLSVLA
jgi:hypothetical protein